MMSPQCAQLNFVLLPVVGSIFIMTYAILVNIMILQSGHAQGQHPMSLADSGWLKILTRASVRLIKHPVLRIVQMG
jgi:hypothetical protein